MGQRGCPPGKGSLSQNHCPPELGGTASFIHHKKRKQAQRWGGTCPELDENRSWLSQRVRPCLLLHSQQPAPPPQGSGAGRREGRVDANGLFCSVSCNRAPAGLPDTCGSAHSSGRDQAGLPDSHSCAKPAGPRALFSAREAPLRAAGGGVGWEGLFLELLSCWGS